MLFASMQWSFLIDTTVALLIGIYFTVKGYRLLRKNASEPLDADWRLPIFRVLGPAFLVGSVICYVMGFLRALQ